MGLWTEQAVTGSLMVMVMVMVTLYRQQTGAGADWGSEAPASRLATHREGGSALAICAAPVPASASAVFREPCPGSDRSVLAVLLG